MQETQETQVRSLGQEDPPEKAMATQSSVLAGEWLSLLPTQRLALEEMLVHQALGGTETHWPQLSQAVHSKCSCSVVDGWSPVVQ